MIAINFGCGSSPTPGYINIDNSFSFLLARSRFASYILYKSKLIDSVVYGFIKDIQKSNHTVKRSLVNLNLEKNSVDVIYSSMVLHHMTKENFIIQCADFYSLLNNGAVMRVVLPDIDVIIDEYKATGDSNILNYQLCNFQDLERNCSSRINILKLFLTGYRGRMCLFSFKDVQECLLEIGFKSVVRLDAGITNSNSDLGELDLYERGAERPMYIEAIK